MASARRAAVAALVGLVAVGWAASAGPIGAAWAAGGGSGGSSGSHSEHAACGAASPGFARCFVHLLDSSTSSSATPSGLPPWALTEGYGFPATTNLSTTTTPPGTGQTVAVVDAYDDPTIASDLSAFSSEVGLPPCTGACVTKVNQSGGTLYPRSNSGWDLEISLDVEWVHALAPGANILLVEASSNSNSNLFTAVSYAASHASYVSMSWGGGESSSETSLDSYFKTSGVSYFAASGDNGAGAEYPSSSPYVVSVGGTTLNLTNSGGTYSYAGETDWSGGGGGCSAYEAAAAAQYGYSSFPQANCGTRRGAPDLSLDADPNTGVSVYDTSGQSGWLTVGGTSASTQFVAAEAAVAHDAMTPSFVYGSTLPFHAIPTCTNGEPSVTSGYNLCTGLGSWNPANASTSGTGGGTGGGGGGTTSTISVSSVSYFLSGRHSSTLNISVALSPAVSNASVSITLYHNGSVYGTGTNTTGSTGTTGFYVSNAPPGTYTTTVTNVSAPGYTWDGATPNNTFTKN